jgi:hypothetical protein
MTSACSTAVKIDQPVTVSVMVTPGTTASWGARETAGVAV